MQPELAALIRPHLGARADMIAESWYHAVAFTGFNQFPSQIVHQKLQSLTTHVIDALYAEPFARYEAQTIGVQLARLHYYAEPETLGRTLAVLGQQIGAGLDVEAQTLLQPALAELLGAIASGFCRELRTIILADQEQLYRALHNSSAREAAGRP